LLERPPIPQDAFWRAADVDYVAVQAAKDPLRDALIRARFTPLFGG
jgi:hypothetical protein